MPRQLSRTKFVTFANREARGQVRADVSPIDKGFPTADVILVGAGLGNGAPGSRDKSRVIDCQPATAVRNDQASGSAYEDKPGPRPPQPGHQRFGHRNELALTALRRAGRTYHDVFSRAQRGNIVGVGRIADP